MHPVMAEKEQKAAQLWKALAFFSALAFTLPPKPGIPPEQDPALKAKGAEEHERLTRKLALKSSLTLLPADHPLTLMTRTLGEKAGVNIHSVFLDSTAPKFYNASIRNDGRNNAAITFYGDPLLEKNGEILARAVTGHEIGHAVVDHTRRNSQAFHAAAEKTAMIYGCLWTPLAATLALPFSMAAAVSVTGLILSFVPIALQQAYRRNNEYMADLTGAEISGDAAESVQDLQYLQRTKISRDAVHPELRRSKQRDVLEVFIGSTHPPMAERIATLRTVFNLQSIPEEPEAPQPERAMTPQEEFRKKSCTNRCTGFKPAIAVWGPCILPSSPWPECPYQSHRITAS